jgi:hypothetical protein
LAVIFDSPKSICISLFFKIEKVSKVGLYLSWHFLPALVIIYKSTVENFSFPFEVVSQLDANRLRPWSI